MEPAKVCRPKSKASTAPDMCRRGDIVKERWRVEEKLGAGTFGQVYRVYDTKSPGWWALKIESKSARKPVLRMDVAITKALSGKLHAVEFFACGHEERFSYMVTQLLGKNLASRKRASQEGRFPLKTVIRIGIQALQALKDLHEAGFLHRDVKPSNLATGVNDRDRYVYLIDFGLARKYLDDQGRIYAPRAKCNFRGTIRYSSYRAHMQKELGRGDDLWSLLYSLVDMRKGRLPWHHIREMKRVGEAKVRATDVALLRDLPLTWRVFFEFCRNLEYDVIPDYDYLERALNGVVEERPTGIFETGQLYVAKWDWDTSESQEGSDQT